MLVIKVHMRNGKLMPFQRVCVCMQVLPANPAQVSAPLGWPESKNLNMPLTVSEAGKEKQDTAIQNAAVFHQQWSACLLCPVNGSSLLLSSHYSACAQCIRLFPSSPSCLLLLHSFFILQFSVSEFCSDEFSALRIVVLFFKAESVSRQSYWV